METLAKGNAALVLDVLSGRLAFERTAVTLYDNVMRKIERGGEPRYRVLLDQLRRIRDQEKEHEEWLEEQIRSLGGTAHETTALSQLELEEATGIKSVIVDGHQNVLHLLHALLSAELADNAGWDILVKLADDTGDRAAKLQFMRRLGEEAQHLAFIREAVVRAAELEILGRSEKLPAGMRDVGRGSLAKPLLGAGALAAVCLGAGALLASAVLANRTRLARTSRRVARKSRRLARQSRRLFAFA
jgi:bacterioferritin (cytochrome b1)